MAISKDQVKTALSHVLHPDEGQDVVSLDMIQDVIVQDHYISFTLEFPEKNDKLENRLKKRCRDAILTFIDKEAVVDITTGINIYRARNEPPREKQKQHDEMLARGKEI